MNLSLLTDLYQLTMLCGYYSHQKLEQQSCFDLYFRRLPFSGGFCLAGGLEPALEWLESLKFEEPQIEYLRSLDLFPGEFLEWLRDFLDRPRNFLERPRNFLERPRNFLERPRKFLERPRNF